MITKSYEKSPTNNLRCKHCDKIYQEFKCIKHLNRDHDIFTNDINSHFDKVNPEDSDFYKIEEYQNHRAKIECPVCREYIRVSRYQNHLKKAHPKFTVKEQVREKHDGDLTIYYSKCRKCGSFIKAHKLYLHLSKCLNHQYPDFNDYLDDSIAKQKKEKLSSLFSPSKAGSRTFKCGEVINGGPKFTRIIYSGLESNRRKH